MEKSNKFNVLLHEISSGLPRNDLESLVDICGIEESRKDEIKSGHKLFNFLRQDGRIEKDNVSFLIEILNTIKRRDLVHHVEKYQGLDTTVSDDAESPIEDVISETNQASSQLNQERSNSVLKDVSETTFLEDRRGSNRSTTRKGANRSECCVVYWPCLEASCYKIHLCYVVLIVLFLLAITVTSVLWYADVPEVSEQLKAKRSAAKGGKFILLGLVCLFPILCIIVYYCRKRYKKDHHDADVFFLNPAIPSASIPGPSDIPMTRDVSPSSPVVLDVNPKGDADCENDIGGFVRFNPTAGDTDPIL